MGEMTTADLRPFQRRFLAAALAPGIEVAALSLPRGNGKTTLLALLATRSLTPGDELFVEGAQNVLIAGSIKQSRPGFRLARAALGEDGFRYEDSNQGTKILHVESGTRMDVHAANAKTALGWLVARLILVDEGAVVSGDLWDAIATTAGKGETTIIVAGTLAPSGRDDWWPKMVKRGSGPGVHVTALQGDPDTWDQWQTIRKCNPLTAVNPRLRKTLLRERDEARRDDRLRARFLSLRLNLPTRTDGRELIPAHQWEAVLERPVPPREGQPVLGLDLGAARSWSAAALWWRNGRCEVYASIPGIPDIDVQERSLGFGRGVLRSMVDRGTVAVAEGKRVADIDVLLDRLPAVDVQGEGIGVSPVHQRREATDASRIGLDCPRRIDVRRLDEQSVQFARRAVERRFVKLIRQRALHGLRERRFQRRHDGQILNPDLELARDADGSLIDQRDRRSRRR